MVRISPQTAPQVPPQGSLFWTKPSACLFPLLWSSHLRLFICEEDPMPEQVHHRLVGVMSMNMRWTQHLKQALTWGWPDLGRLFVLPAWSGFNPDWVARWHRVACVKRAKRITFTFTFKTLWDAEKLTKWGLFSCTDLKSVLKGFFLKVTWLGVVPPGPH